MTKPLKKVVGVPSMTTLSGSGNATSGCSLGSLRENGFVSIAILIAIV